MNKQNNQLGSLDKTAVIYTRAACREQAVCRPKVPSVEAQLDACRQVAKQNNLTVINWVADHGCKGRLAQRLGLRKLLHHVAEQHPDYLIIANDSRLGRNVDDLTDILSQLAEANVKLMVANDPEGQLEGIFNKLRTMRQLIRSQTQNAAPDPPDIQQGD